MDASHQQDCTLPRRRATVLLPVKERQMAALQLITINPLNMEREVMAANIPEGWFQFTPDEKSLIYTLYTEGRKKDAQVYDVKEPDDRQPGWRSRSYLAKYDLASGILQPLTFGYHNVYLNDISADSRYLLIGKSEERLTKRPTTLNSPLIVSMTERYECRDSGREG